MCPPQEARPVVHCSHSHVYGDVGRLLILPVGEVTDGTDGCDRLSDGIDHGE